MSGKDRGIYPFQGYIARFPDEPFLPGVPQKAEESAFYVPRRRLPAEIALPERSGNIDPTVIRIVNESLQQAYPREFGKVIPQLDSKDVLIVSDDSYRTYNRKIMDVVGHSYISTFTTKSEETSTQRKGSDAVTLFYLPHKPILYTESLLRGQQDLGKELGPGIVQAQIALALIHENIHRSARVNREINPSDGLINLGISVLVDHYNRLPDEQSREKGRAILEEVRDYFKSHKGEVEIWGGLIMLMCEDDHGEKRQLMGSGYDINERFVEMIAQKAKDVLLKRLLQINSGDPVLRILVEKMRNYDHASVNERRISEEEAYGYLESLGIEKDELIDPYSNGSIPFKHIKKLANSAYPI